MFGVTTDYDYNAYHRRDKVDVWTGPFMLTWVGRGFSLPRGDGYMIETYHGDRVRVECPTPRNDETYEQVDAAISAAMTAYHEATTVSVAS